VQLIAGIEQTGRVEHDHLDVAGGANAHHAVTSGLRLLADDRQLLSDDPVEQRGLAGVRLTDDGHDSGARHDGIVRRLSVKGEQDVHERDSTVRSGQRVLG
jgi:hypothetical protein